MKQSHLTVTVDMMKTLLLQTVTVMQVRVKFVFGRDHNTFQHTWNSGGIHPFTGCPSGLRIQEAPHVNKDSTPITAFLLFFMEVSQLLVAETNKFYSQYLDKLDSDSRHSHLTDMNVHVHLFGHNNTNET